MMSAAIRGLTRCSVPQFVAPTQSRNAGPRKRITARAADRLDRLGTRGTDACEPQRDGWVDSDLSTALARG
jgi:hypothetical protein